MAENDPAGAESGDNSDDQQVEPRAPRSTRFFDSERARIEEGANAREMTTAELVRHAAVSFAADKLTANSPAFPLEIAAETERIYRGVSLLSTPKRDEVLREELDRIGKDARESQSLLQTDLAPPQSPLRNHTKMSRSPTEAHYAQSV